MTDLLIGMNRSNGFHTVGSSSKNTGDVVYRKRNSGVFRNSEMRHSRSEDILGPEIPLRTPSPLLHEQTCASEDDLVASSALRDASSTNSLIQEYSLFTSYDTGRSSPPPIPPPPAPRTAYDTDRIDPEDSIRDIVTENDLYRFVLFKRHYDKYMALAEKYEESKGLAYYLEERYHEVKAERDRLEEARLELERRLENREVELRDKEEELFLHLERSLRLDDEIERLKSERDACSDARKRLEREQASTLKQLQMQATENELTRRNLEQARHDVVRQATVIRTECDALERENKELKEELGAERRRREEGIAILTHEAATLRHTARHLRAAALHATSCKRRRRCSVCSYAKRTFAKIDDYRDEKLFKCLQTPLRDFRSWIRPGPLPSTSTSSQCLRNNSPFVPKINYIDDSSSSSEDEDYGETPLAEVSLSSTNSGVPPTSRAFSSDSGFSSEVGDRRSRSYEAGGSSRKISESSTSDVDLVHGAGTSNGAGNYQRTFTRSKWTSSFRKLLGRKSKTKLTDINTS